jgi:hypothetical protein
VSEAERTHGPPCTAGKDGGPCTRCTGFLPGHEHRVGEGNDLAVTHGAYAELQLSPRVVALAARLREAGEHLTAADEAGLAVAALSAIQLSCATGALEEVAEAIERGEDVDRWLGRLESKARLSKDARAWSNTVRQWLDSLGLTPAGRRNLEDRTLTVIHHVQPLMVAFLVSVAELVPPERRGELEAKFDELEGELRALEPGPG